MGALLFLGKGLDEWFLGFGSGRVDALGSLTLMEGTDGVTEIDGVFIFGVGVDELLTEMVGIGLTEIDGAFTLPRLAGLTEIDGASWTAIVGTGGAGDGLERAEGVWETFIVGMGGVVF